MTLINIVVLLLAIAFKGGLGDMGPRSRLFEQIMYKSYKDIIPVENNDTVVNVGHSLDLLRVNTPVDGVVKLDVWETLSWQNERFKWDPEEYGGIHSLQVPSTYIWLPDIVVLNVDKSRTTFDDSETNVHLFADGTMTLVRDRCLYAYVDKDAFSVNLKFMSWTYNGFLINIYDASYNNGIDMSNFEISKNGITVKNATAVRNEVTYACCPEPYPNMQYFIEFEEPGWFSNYF